MLPLSFVRVLTVAAFSLLLVFCAAGLHGCASSSDPVVNNAVRYAQTEQVYTSTVRTATALAQQGKLNVDAAEKFEAARSSAARLLDAWRASVVAGLPWDGWASLESVLEELIRIPAQAQAEPIAGP